jgi:Protein of unknown function (DUF1275)
MPANIAIHEITEQCPATVSLCRIQAQARPMESAQHARHVRTKAGVALLLTFAAGCVDIVGFITLYHTFTAHMTGATVHLGQNLLDRKWLDAASAGCVVVAFLAGSVIGRAIIEIGSRKGVRSIASATLLLEAALIAGVVPLADGNAGGCRGAANRDADPNRLPYRAYDLCDRKC